MKNITLAMDEKTIKAGREYARRRHMTLNALIRKLLEQTVSRESKNWIEEYAALADKLKASPVKEKWKREDLYRV